MELAATMWRESPNAEGLWVEFDPTKPIGAQHYTVEAFHSSETWDERGEGDKSWYFPIPFAPGTTTDDLA